MKRIIIFLVFLLSFSLVSAISVDDFSLADLGFTGFVVEANLDTSGTAQVLYGKTGALGSATNLVSSSSEHLLQVDNLQENTVYFYRVVGKDSQGNSYSSAISLTRTPTSIDDTLPAPNPGPTSSSLKKIQTTYDEVWDREYQARYKDLSEGGHEGDIYYWFGGFDGNLAMFQATGDTQYLDNALLMFNNLMKIAKPSNSFPHPDIPAYTTLRNTEYPRYTDTYLGWDNHGDPVTSQGVTQGGHASLHEGHGLRQVPKLLWVLQNSPKLRAVGYQDDYDRIKAFFETNVWDKWESRSIGNFYRSRTHMASHWANMAMYLYEIEDNPTRKAKYFRMFNEFNTAMELRTSSRYLNAPTASMRGQLRPHPKAPGGYVWNGEWGKMTGANDHSHANAEVNFMINGHELGYEWTAADMKALRITLNDVLFLGDAGRGDVPFYLDGTFRSNYRNTAWFDHGWSMLGRFDQVLQNRLQTRDMGQSSSSRYQSVFWGNIAYNQAYLDGNVKYPENYYSN